MRRKDREVTDPRRIDGIIGACDCIRLGIATNGAPYVVPMNFGYTRMGEQAVFYLHCAREGRKLDLLRQNPCVGFTLDTNHLVHTDEAGCAFSFRFQSVIGTGDVFFVTDVGEKKDALRRIVAQYSARDDWTFTDAQTESVTVLRLRVAEMTCKEHA
jgi:hypothetical protein